MTIHQSSSLDSKSHRQIRPTDHLSTRQMKSRKISWAWSSSSNSLIFKRVHQLIWTGRTHNKTNKLLQHRLPINSLKRNRSLLPLLLPLLNNRRPSPYNHQMPLHLRIIHKWTTSRLTIRHRAKTDHWRQPLSTRTSPSKIASHSKTAQSTSLITACSKTRRCKIQANKINLVIKSSNKWQ